MQHQLIQNWSTLAMITDTDSKPHVFFLGGANLTTHILVPLCFGYQLKKKKKQIVWSQKKILKQSFLPSGGV